MSERITAANLDEVIKRNEVIEEQMKQSASLIWSKYNPMQINSPIQLALQILRPYGLIQLPIDNHYLSGAIFVRDGKRIPLINTALPRANQYFTAWHEIYHLLFDEVSFDHLIESEILMEERKAEYFAALMLLGNLMPYFEGLKDMEFQAKAFQCMNAFQAPYKAVLISLYESAVKNGNTAIAEEVKENFDVQVEDIAQRFRDLGLDDSLVRPSYVVNVSPLQEKINKTIRNEPEVEYHKDNAHEFQTNAERILTGNSEFTPALDSPISVAFKSNDFILCQMYREGALTLDAVRQLRHDDRKLTYTRQQADKSIICRKEVITKEQFIDLIQDATVQILF